VDVESFEVDNGRFIQCQVGFSIATRRGRGVVQISEVGVKAPDKAVAQKYVVLACVNKLTNIGYTLPTYSSMSIQAMDAGSYHDVAGFCARIARNQDVVKSKSNSYYLDLLLYVGKLGSHIHFSCQHLQVEDYDNLSRVQF